MDIINWQQGYNGIDTEALRQILKIYGIGEKVLNERTFYEGIGVCVNCYEWLAQIESFRVNVRLDDTMFFQSIYGEAIMRCIK